MTGAAEAIQSAAQAIDTLNNPFLSDDPPAPPSTQPEPVAAAASAYPPRARPPPPPYARDLPLGPLALERDAHGPPRDPYEQLAEDRARYLARLRALYPDPEAYRAAVEEDRAMMLGRPLPPRRRPLPPRGPYRDPYDPYLDDYLPPPPPRRRPPPYEGGYRRPREPPARSRPQGGARGPGGSTFPPKQYKKPQGKELKDWVKRAIEESQDDEGKQPCPANGCDRMYRNDQNLFHHWREAHLPFMWKFTCLMCTTQCKRVLGIRRHYVNEHGLEADDIMPWVNFVVVCDRKSKNAQFKDPKRTPPEGFVAWDENLRARFVHKSDADPRLLDRLNLILSVREQGIQGSGDERTKKYQELDDERIVLFKEAGLAVGEEPPEGSELATKIQDIEDKKLELCRPGPELWGVLGTVDQP